MTTALLEEAEIQEAEREAFRVFFRKFQKDYVDLVFGGLENFRKVVIRDRPLLSLMKGKSRDFSIQYGKRRR